MIQLTEFKVGKTIHLGPYARILRGQRRSDGKAVLIKMPASERPSFAQVTALRHEYDVMKLLKGKEIVPPIAFEQVGDTCALVLELFEGVSLKEYLNNKPLGMEAFLRIARPLVATLKIIHSCDIIHKDIKPGNILYNPTTFQVKVIDFGLASQVARERQDYSPPSQLEGTLSYISPEQTGRMNRAIDYRSDFYSLGVTFYRMLTGRLPFEESDPMSLIHAHIAKSPIPVREVNQAVPEAVSDMITKLMAKPAEGRYQSAYGLERDLDECARLLREKQNIEYFPPGMHDLTEKFGLSQQLYGRESAVATLLESFQEVSAGGFELLLVTGYSGVGKTSVIKELHRPISEKRGVFISGKFNKFNRDMPYTALIQAVSSLLGQLLTEDESMLQRKRELILLELGSRGQVFIDLIPELALILGQLPAVAPLPVEEAQFYFNKMFRQLLTILADGPLVLFLDDLQWADSATLSFLQFLATSVETRSFMLLGAYRDNEVSPEHPLMHALNAIAEGGGNPRTLRLQPLNLDDMVRFTGDTLNHDSQTAEPLARLVLEKTNGNPFFAGHFLISLYERQHLIFDQTRRCWTWDLAKIQKLGITDNVVELMADKIGALSARTKRVLQLASCCGNTFDLNSLASINDRSETETAGDLWEAVLQGLVLSMDTGKPGTKQEQEIGVEFTRARPMRTNFKFVHDRIQQAAYSLLTETEKKKIHLKIGRLQLVMSERKRDLLQFNTVNHLNYAESLIQDPEDRIELAELNLVAGRKAVASIAYETALNLFSIGIGLLPETAWQTQYALTLKLHMEKAETLQYTSQIEAAEKFFDFTLTKAVSPLEKARIHLAKTSIDIYRNEMESSVNHGLAGLELLGIVFPKDEAHICEQLARERANLKLAFQDREIKDLINLPKVTDPTTQCILKLLTELFMAATYSVPHKELSKLVIVKTLHFRLAHGNDDGSGHLYANYGYSLAFDFDEYRDGCEFGYLALELCKTLDSQMASAKVNSITASAVLHWGEPSQVCRDLLRNALKVSLEFGDLNHAVLTYWAILLNLVVCNKRLRDVYVENEKALALSKKNGLDGFLNFFLSFKYWLHKIGGSQETLIDEKTHLAQAEALGPFNLYVYYFLAGKHLFILGEKKKAADFFKMIEENGYRADGTLWISEENFLTSLILADGYEQSKDQEGVLRKLAKNQCTMKMWADLNPDNFLHEYLMVEAEIARIKGRRAEASDLYVDAIDAGRKYGHVLPEALACELAANFFMADGKQRIADLYLFDAYTGYKRWGAGAKVDLLEKRFPQLLVPTDSGNYDSNLTVANHSNSTSANVQMSALDWLSFIKASQAISGEIVLGTLLKSLMNNIMKNAGAGRVYLLLSRSAGLSIEAVGKVDEDLEIASRPLQGNDELASSVVSYVSRTRESLVLDDAVTEEKFAGDPYIAKNRPRSILCMPIILQAKLIGVLYLENNLICGAFTQQRLNVLNILVAQAAISIENARLYSRLEDHSKTLEQKVLDRTAELHEKNMVMQEKNEQIWSSIRYAQRIQRGILPYPEKMRKALPPYFLIYRSRDLVSGDFYWFKEVGDKILVAVVDCTGHGVPGALMTMVGHSLLNRVSGEDGIEDPAHILELLHVRVRQTLQQERDTRTQDGMEVCLCLIHKNQSKLVFAGAGRPLYWVRFNGENQQGEITVIKGDRQSVGGKQKEERRVFTNTEIHPAVGDMIYLSTDGFVDQSNTERQKFGSMKLKRLLEENAVRGVDFQKQVLTSALADHQKNQQQRDDITILGLKIPARDQ